MEYQELGRKLTQYPEVYLYGAGVVAYGVYKAIAELFGITIKGFLVTERRGEWDQIEGISVFAVEGVRLDRKKSLIIIAAPEEYHHSMEERLLALRLRNFLRLDSHTEYALMGNYLKKIQGLKLIEDAGTGRQTENDDEIGVYMAVSHRDRILNGKYSERPWVKKIQAGAALTDERIAGITDGDGDNISGENTLYGELTASYYIWKHSKYEITGLFHYRRVLDVTKEQLYLLKERKADVILPLPFVCYPNASGQYGRYILPEDAVIMKQVLKEKKPESFDEMMAVLDMPYLYNYNMLIARKEVFDAYCGWMFPILKEIADRCQKEKRNRLPRYIGRIGEVLTSIYFTQSGRDWNIVHGKKIWRV